MKLKLLVILFISFCFQGCDIWSNKLKLHFTEKMYLDAVLLINTTSVKNANKHVDSLMQSFEYISVLDKYTFYKFKVKTYVGINAKPLDYQKAQLYADSMIMVIENNDLKEKLRIQYAEAFNFKSIYYIDEGNYVKALDEAIKARTLIEQTKDLCGLSNYLANEGQIYFRMEKYEQAKASFEKEYALMKHCPQDMNYFYKYQLVLGNIGLCYRNLNDYKNSLKYNFLREQYIIKNKGLIANNPEFVNVAFADVYRKISLNYFHEKKYLKALEYLNKTETFNTKIRLSDDDKIWYKLYTIGVLVALEQFNKADSLLKIFESDSNILNAQNRKSYYKVKFQIAAKTNNLKDETVYTKKYYELSDSLNNDIIKYTKIDPESKFEEVKQEMNLALLKKDNQLNKIYLAIFIGLLILSLVFLYFSRKNLNKKNKLYDRIKKLNDKLLENEKYLKQLNQDLEQSKEKQKQEALQLQKIKLELAYKDELLTEKEKISNELHDGVSGTLAALKYYLTDPTIKANNNPKVIEEIESEISYVYNNLRNFLLKLQSEKNQRENDLFTFLKHLANKFNQGSLLKVYLNYDEDKLKKKLSEFEKLQLRFIINEAFANVIKHSNASKLELSIYIKEDICEFSIQDNGVGFENIQDSAGLGLKNIEKRIKELNGDLKINTNSESGTEIWGKFTIKS